MRNARIRLTTPISGYLDIKDGSNFPITMSVGDIRDISKRNGSYSKTITIVGNKQSNKILGHLYDVNIAQETFNINTLQECLVEQDGIVILDNMYLQLTRVYKVQKPGSHDYDVEYEAEIRDSSADFFSKISNLELTDLDFSDFTHIYNVASITASFDNTYLNGYKYLVPFINANAVNYDIKDFKPGIYARNYWDKIFDTSGYTWEFDEKDDFEIQFDKLFIPYNGDIPKPIEDRTSWVIADKIGVPFTQSTVPSSPVYPAPVTVKLDNELQDIYGYYNPSLGQYTVPYDLTITDKIVYEFNVVYDFEIYNHRAFSVSAVGPTKKPIEYSVRLYAGETLGTSFNNIGSRLQVPMNQVLAPGQTLTLGTNVSDNVTVTVSGLTINDVIKNWLNTWENSAVNNLTYQKWVVTGNNFNNANTYITHRAIIKSIEVTIKPDLETLVLNSVVNLNNFVPKKVKQSDFVKSICQMYNLYIDIDDNDRTNLIIKTRDKFYDDGTVVNWTKKFAKDKPHDVKFLPELSNKKLVLTYKADTDVANKGYLDNVKEVYGQIEYVFENEYVKGVDKKELIFSPTPNTNTGFGANVPIINGIAPKNNIRILLDGGQKSCTSYSITESVNNSYNIYTYPFLSHFNDALNPTFDINYGMCDYYFYNPSTTTDNNLYNLHWRRTLGQINNGKLLTAYFNLNAIDIQKIELSHKVRIDNSYWNINKIIDYNANGNNLTKVELISIDDELELPAIKTKTIVKPNVSDVIIRPIKTDRADYLNNDLSGGAVVVDGVYNNISSTSDGFVRGDRNTIDANGFVDVRGSGNTVKSSSTIIGEDNTVEEGLEGVIIISDGVTAYLPNTLYSDNVVAGPMIYGTAGISFDKDYFVDGYVDGGYVGASASEPGTYWSYDDATDETTYEIATDNLTINGTDILESLVPSITSFTASGLITTGVSLIDSNIGVITLELPSAIGLTSSKYIIKDKGGNAKVNNITINTTASQTIDGTASYTMRLNYEAITLLSDGGSWWIV